MWLIRCITDIFSRVKNDEKIQKLSTKIDKVAENMDEKLGVDKIKKTNNGAVIVSSDPQIAATQLDLATLSIEISLIKSRVDELKTKHSISKEEAEELNHLENSIKNLTSSLDSKK